MLLAGIAGAILPAIAADILGVSAFVAGAVGGVLAATLVGLLIARHDGPDNA